jgi:hypothetical protein
MAVVSTGERVDFLVMIGFVLLNLVVALIVGQVTIRLMDTTANPAMREARS